MGDDDLRSRFRRDYSSEPIRTNSRGPAPLRPEPQASEIPQKPHTPVKLPETVPRLKSESKRIRKRNRKRFVIVGILILAAIGAASYWYLMYKQNSSEDKAILSAAKAQNYTAPVYYPTNLPSGYSVSKNLSNGEEKDILIYTVKDPANIQYTVTLQSLTDSAGFTKLRDKFSKDDTSQFNTSVGSAIVGRVGTSLLGAQLTNDSVLIIVNPSDTKAKDATVETILRSFQLIKG